MRVVFRPIVVASVLLVAAGCTAESAAPATTSSTSSTSTTQPTTSSITTTSSTTTSTTLDAASEIEAEVEAAYLRSYEVFVECYRTLPDCDPNEVFPDVYAPPTLQRQILGALETQAEGLIYGPPENPDHARTEVFNITVAGDMTAAVVSFCTFAGDREYIINADGTRTLTDDLLLVEWGDADLVKDEQGVWRVSDYPEGIGDDDELPPQELDRRIQEGTLCGGFVNE